MAGVCFWQTGQQAREAESRLAHDPLFPRRSGRNLLGCPLDVIDWMTEQFGWMHWSWQSAVFFGAIFTTIAALTVWDLFSPGVRSKGFLPVETTRGDRLFLGIVLTIGLFLVWLASVGNQALWGAAALALATNVALARWG